MAHCPNSTRQVSSAQSTPVIATSWLCASSKHGSVQCLPSSVAFFSWTAKKRATIRRTAQPPASAQHRLPTRSPANHQLHTLCVPIRTCARLSGTWTHVFGRPGPRKQISRRIRSTKTDHPPDVLLGDTIQSCVSSSHARLYPLSGSDSLWQQSCAWLMALKTLVDNLA